MKTKAQLQEQIDLLRKFIDEKRDPVETRIAYAIECVLYHIIRDTDHAFVDEAKEQAWFCRQDLELEAARNKVAKS